MDKSNESSPLSRRDFIKLVGAAAAFFISKPLKDLEPTHLPGVDFDSRGVMSIDDKPTLPVVMYGLPGDPAKEGSWIKAKEAGVNMISMVFITPDSLSYAEKYGLKLFARLDYEFPDAFSPRQADIPKEELFRKWDAKYKGYLYALENQPSIIGFEVDEPDLIRHNEEQGNQTWYSVKNLDTFLEWFSVNSIRKLPLRITPASGTLYEDKEKYLEGIYKSYNGNIISGPNQYVPAQDVYEYMTGYRKYWEKNPDLNSSVWALVSAHSDSKAVGGMILDEEKIMQSVVAAIVAGSRGIGFYDNAFNCDSSSCSVDLPDNGKINAFGETYEAVQAVVARIGTVKEALLGDDVGFGISGTTVYRRFRTGSKVYKFSFDLSGTKPADISVFDYKGSKEKNIPI